MVICLKRSTDLHMAQLMPLPLTVCCFSKIQIDFTFLLLAYPGSPGKGPFNGCFPTSENFQNKVVFYMYFYVCATLHNFIQFAPTVTKLRNHLVYFYSLLEKCEKLQYLCNGFTNLHKTRHK